MRKYVLPLLTALLAGYGAHVFAAESKAVVIDEVPDSVKEMNALPPEEQKQQDEAELASAEAFDSAAESAAQKNPNR